MIIVAPHAVNHIRDGKTKLADRGTGSLALMLAEHLNCWGIIDTVGISDASWVTDHPVKHKIEQIISSLSASARERIVILDLHGMCEREDQVQIEIGFGAQPNTASLKLGINFIEELQANGISAISDGRFQARRPTSITSWAQTQGWEALHIEISPSLRPPVGTLPHLAKFFSSLIEPLSAKKRNFIRDTTQR